MQTSIFVNLPVKDLEKSKKFYTSIGFTINQQFTDKTAACIVISENIYVMLLTYAKCKEFTKKEIADAHKTTEVLNALSRDSKEAVDEIADKAIEAGGTKEYGTQDLGLMYSRSFNDPDGHIWEAFWMDESKM